MPFCLEEPLNSPSIAVVDGDDSFPSVLRNSPGPRSSLELARTFRKTKPAVTPIRFTPSHNLNPTS